MCQSGSHSVQLLHIRQGPGHVSDKENVRQAIPLRDMEQTSAIPWAMQMRAVSMEEPSRLVQTLTGAILGCGGWVLSRGANESGGVNMLFEFERQTCVDIYSVLIAVGLDLSQHGSSSVHRAVPVHASQPASMRHRDRQHRPGDPNFSGRDRRESKDFAPDIARLTGSRRTLFSQPHVSEIFTWRRRGQAQALRYQAMRCRSCRATCWRLRQGGPL